MWYVHKNILGTRRDEMVKKKVVLKIVCYECLKEIFYGEHARAEWKKNRVGVSGKLRSVSELQKSSVRCQEDTMSGRYRVVWLCGICIDNYCTLNKLKW
jgi:hypothetical protein